MGWIRQNKPWYKFLPSDELDICEENLDLFFKTMFERQEVWYKRFILKEERPWTEDVFLANNKFTNVYRELDRNTQYQIENVYKKENNKKQLLWKILFFRFFNSPEFFEFIKGSKKSFEGIIPDYEDFDSDELKRLMDQFRAVKGNPFTNAYLTNSLACPGKTRDECFAFKVIPSLHKLVPELLKMFVKMKNPSDLIKLILTLPSVSDFMAHEFYQDLTYSERYSGIRFMKFDQNDYTNVGPGAEIGIRLIFPSLSNMKDKEEAIHILRDLSEQYLSKFGQFKYLGYKDGKYFHDKKGDVTLHQIEMFLCEFQKYWKMMIGEGKQRSIFVPKTEVK